MNMTKPTIVRQLEQKIADLQELLDTHSKNIYNLKKQRALYAGTPPLELLNRLDYEQEQFDEVKEQLELLKAARKVLEELQSPGPPGVPPPRRWFPWVIALVALVIGVAIGGIVSSTIQKGGLPLLPGLRATPTTEVLVARVVRTDSEIQIDGLLEEAWLEGDSLTYAVHPAENGSTTATVRLLWDENYLYVGFDVNDTQVERAHLSTPWDSDSVSLLLHDGGIAEHRQSLGEELGDYLALHKKKQTTLYDTTDTDRGYTVEMRIRWRQSPEPGRLIRADLLSVDHDGNPGAMYDDSGTKFSKLSWDGDGDITSAGARLLLVDGEHSGSE